MRGLRTLLGWKPTTVRADLKDILDAMSPGESGFSPEESRMLKNILGLRERRVGDVMIPRADIVAVQQDIKLGDLVRVFEKASHSRLVVYNDTLDDPVGMVHIRDLMAWIADRALARFLDEVGGRPNVWVATRLDIARHWIATHPPVGADATT